MKPEQQPATTHLINFLKTKLPSYMIPSAFIYLESLPLTPNGKLDRKLLGKTDDLRSQPEVDYVGPRNETEEIIADVWKQVLGLRDVHVEKNFFELGGHSLLATQVASRLQEAFQINLPLPKLFEAPTVAELALVISQCQIEQVDADQISRILAELEQ